MVDYYQNLYKVHGYSPDALGWPKGKQFLRFHQLTSSFDLENSSVLDVGCGFGDFINYLRLSNISNCDYTGVDVVEEFIEKAKQLHTDDQAKFLHSDLLDADLDGGFDYAFASGTFNMQMDGVDGYENISKNMKKMFEMCTKAISIDFITDRVDYSYPHNFNSSPEKILSMAYGLSKSVVLQNNYFPFEFAITIFKDDSFSKKSAIFSETEESLSWLGI